MHHVQLNLLSDINAYIAEYPRLQKDFQRLSTIPGIGERLAFSQLADCAFTCPITSETLYLGGIHHLMDIIIIYLDAILYYFTTRKASEYLRKKFS